MPFFQYKPLPATGAFAFVDAVDEDAARTQIGTGNFDATYGFSISSLQPENLPTSIGTILGMVVTYSRTEEGTQNFGSDPTNKTHVLEQNITGFDALSSTPFANNGLFVIINEQDNVAEFDISATGLTFAGLASGNAYNLPSNSSILFYVGGTNVFPLANLGNANILGDHPVVLIRDTPSVTELQALAEASLNDNSALWVVANDQIQSTEDNVDPTVMIRALSTGRLTADNSEISMTAVQKRTVRLQAGTIVRVFSSTDLRVVSTPTIRAQAARYPDIFTTLIAGDVLSLVGNQVLYNTYRNRTAVVNINTAGFVEIRLPSLQNAVDLAYLNRNDVFCFRHAGTNGEVRVRTFQVGTIFSDTTQQITLDPGETLCVSPAPSGAVWTIVALGQNADIDLADIIMSDWYRDGVDATAADNSVRLHHREEIVSGNVREHVKSVGPLNNPATIRFQQHDIEDDIAWVNWWSTINSSVPPVSIGDTTLMRIEIQAALDYIENTVPANYDFELFDPATIITLTAVTFVSGSTVKFALSSALPAHIIVNDIMRVNSNSYAGNNGDWAITQIYSDRLAFDVTIPGSSSANDTGASGFVDRPLFCRTVLNSSDLRQHNFDIYRNSARNNPVDAFAPGWFDITTEPAPADCILSIGYNNSIQTTASRLITQGRSGDFFSGKAGPVESVFAVDNTVGTGVDLPLNFPIINIKTTVQNVFYLPVYPDELEVGEIRRYALYAHSSNGVNNTLVSVGRSGGVVTFDEGFSEINILPGRRIVVEVYNDGENNGARLGEKIVRSVKSQTIYDTLTDLPSVSHLLPVTAANIDAALDQDSRRNIYDFPAGQNRITFNVAGRYHVRLSIQFFFAGAETSGVQYATAVMVPYLNNASFYEVADIQSLILTKNGASSGVGARMTLYAIFDYEAAADDYIDFELQSVLPTGRVLTDFQILDFRYSVIGEIGE